MSEIPKFVQVARQYIPKEGVETDYPNRVKSKIKKALTKAGIETTTIRGIGQQVGEYAIVYQVEGSRLTASIQEFATVESRCSKSRKRSSRSGRSKKSPLLTGVHPSVVSLTSREFASEVMSTLPKVDSQGRKWEYQNPKTYRWISTDIDFLMKTQHTVETAVERIVSHAQFLLSHLEVITFTLIDLDDHYLIGIGPS